MQSSYSSLNQTLNILILFKTSNRMILMQQRSKTYLYWTGEYIFFNSNVPSILPWLRRHSFLNKKEAYRGLLPRCTTVRKMTLPTYCFTSWFVLFTLPDKKSSLQINCNYRCLITELKSCEKYRGLFSKL